MTYENIAAVWLKKDKNGKTYLSLKVERDLKAGESISLFRNDKGGNEKRPDFRAYERVTEAKKVKEVLVDDVADDIPF